MSGFRNFSGILNQSVGSAKVAAAQQVSAGVQRAAEHAIDESTHFLAKNEHVATAAAGYAAALAGDAGFDTSLDDAEPRKVTEVAASPALADPQILRSHYWLQLQTNRSGDLNSGRLGGRLYPNDATGIRHMWTDMIMIFINELLASTVLGTIIFLVLTVMHESQQTGSILNYFMAAIIIPAAAYVVNVVFPNVHVNPNLTLYLFLRECFAGTSYDLHVGGASSAVAAAAVAKTSNHWRIVRCALRTLVQIGCQMLGFIVAAIAVYYSDYMRHLHRVAESNNLQPLPVAFFLDLGQTMPNASLEIGEWNAWGMECAATFFLIYVVGRAIEINTQTNMDAYATGSPSAMRLHARGQTNSAWEGIYTQKPVLVALALDLVVLGNITGASMNWARSFGPAWFAYNQRKNDPVGVSDADPFSGLRHLWGYVVAQILAVVTVIIIHCVSMWIERRKLAQRLGFGSEVTMLDERCVQLEKEQEDRKRG